jgi:hypothetical protein
MKPPRAPRIDERRTPEFLAEMEERARVWIPSWGLSDNDFGRALLEIAARFDSEVAERLDGAGEKMRRGFLDWLAVRGEAARPARMPVVFKLADTAREGVLASAPVRMQADAAGTPVVFETEKDVRIVPGQLDVVVGIDADNDAFYLPPPGLSDLKPLEPLPTQWQLKSFAAAGVTSFQLDPEAGLLPGTIIEAGDQQYRIAKADNDLVTIDRPLVNALAGGSVVTKVTTFSPFDGRTYNQQQHALYLGDSELLNVVAEATIEVVGAAALREGFAWEYWGKLGEGDEVKWQPLGFDKEKQASIVDAVVVTKPKGEIVEREVGGKKSRWLRAFAQTIKPDASPINAEDFSLRINASACGNNPTICPPVTAVESPEAEAMANTTPLVLDNIFLPLGREPRQFDAFYLGSAEAFSKKGAQVRICFELADPTFASLAAVHGTGPFANNVLAGIGRDHALHLFQFVPADATISRFRDRDPLRPPIPGDSGAVPASTKPIGLNPKCRPVVTTLNNDFSVDVAAGGTIWTWHENAGDGHLSGWKTFDPLPEPPNDPAQIDDIVPVIIGINSPKVVLSRSRLFVHDTIEWLEKPTGDFTGSPPASPPTNPTPVTLVALVPIWEDTGSGLDGLEPGSEMVGVSDDNLLYRVTTDGECRALPLLGDLVDTGTAMPGLGALRPAAYLESGKIGVVTANDTRDKLVSYRRDITLPIPPPADVGSIALPLGHQIIGTTVEMSFVKGEAQFSVLCTTEAGATYVASWQPFAISNTVKDILFRSNFSSSGSLGGAPVMLAPYFVAPGARGDLFVASFDRFQRYELQMPAVNADEDGVVLSSTVNPFITDDAFSIDSRTDAYLVNDPMTISPDPEILYPVKPPFIGPPVGADPELRAYRRDLPVPPNPPFNGTIVGSSHLQLSVMPLDNKTVEGTFLLIDDPAGLVVLRVVTILAGVAEVDPALLSSNVPADYWVPEPVGGRIAPVIRLDPPTTGTWLAPILEHARLYFLAPVDPEAQRAKVFAPDTTSHPTVIALQSPWVTPPLANDPYVIDATLGEWQHVLADTSSNPELSWEYSNGKAWGPLILEEEGTLNFKNTGAIRFRVPNDLAAVDWAGKTNHWIRARLIGGDFGREEITVKTKTVGSETHQIVDRVTTGIHPPSVVKLQISYGFCTGVLPAYVLAEDSGTMRDQSDANRTQGAIVEAFVPLALTLGRLTKTIPATDPPQPGEACPPDCDCKTLYPIKAETPSGVTSAASEPARLTGREVYIGLAATPSEAPVNALLLVEEQKHTEFAPMSIEALAADRFVPIVADDATRALGESGVLSMTFAVPPVRSELFGKKDLSWLRLIPKQANDNWIPTLRGAYLNAAWASATETLTRELLGSSDGAPNLSVFLARPPLLRNTLELRVKEPLGDEERKELLQLDSKSVLSAVERLPGDWVLWAQVIDPDDEPATARVYALDETSGEVRFGDGRHGKIPPIGRDSIVAFSYARTEPDPTGGDSVPGNKIAPRTALNLVSPVETVESVIAADQAAGGAPPESDERVLRFGFARLRHRSRAVTPEDLEDLTLESLPDIAQARAFVLRGYIRLVIVMRGKNPVPNAAQIRELRRLLLDAAPASLSAPNVLRIEGPGIRRLRIELQLLVESLDHAGQLSSSVKKKLGEFFDTATGGLDKGGWALGAKPSEEDIALAISDAPYLESIEKVKLYGITEDGKELPLEAPGSRDIVMLADDPIRIQFETAEVTV